MGNYFVHPVVSCNENETISSGNLSSVKMKIEVIKTYIKYYVFEGK